MRTRHSLSAATAPRRLLIVALVATGVGAGVLLVAAAVEVVNGQPGMSLADGYWVGRLPWTPIGVGLVLYGASATVVVAAAAAWLGPRWGARVLSAPALLSSAFWWGTASLTGMSGACCSPPPRYDPITVAYSAPIEALLFLVVPALVMGLAVRPRRQVVRLAGPAADQYRTVSGA